MPPRKKKTPDAVGLSAEELGAETPPASVAELVKQIGSDGGAALATYREPFGKQWVVLAALPIEKVEPTPYQREQSKPHTDRLVSVVTKVSMYLDPVIAVRQSDRYWTPNGMHRLSAMKSLGAKSITALVLPDPKIAYRILALNTQKAHNLRDKALEVVRMARGLAALSQDKESAYAFEFEEPAYLTIGMCYEANGRFSGSAYLPVVKRCDDFRDEPLSKSLAAREKSAKKLLELDEAVNEAVKKLKEAGLTSAYLKPFVVARINPLRFQKASKPGEKAPRAELDATLAKMLASAKKLDASKVKPQDLASMSGPPPEE